eukprot:GHRR01037608.1.p1 GENE.GHRR01037608.1~~GHRR01037608.1.p1  ORF type:complete len:117 (-),score=24.66 GHRR01037608.1:231-542(-)
MGTHKSCLLFIVQHMLCSNTCHSCERHCAFLMHVRGTYMHLFCLQCDASDLALDVFQQMYEDRIRPNVVTYNTLVDVYGKTGQWEKAVRVLDDMREEVSSVNL